MIKEQVIAYSVNSLLLGESEVNEAIDYYNTLKPKAIKTVKTSDSRYVIKVARLQGKDFAAWLLFDNSPIACVSFVNRDDIGSFKAYEAHAFVSKERRQQGIVSMLYTWFLNSGRTLITESHTIGAKALWDKLSKKFKHGYWLAEEQRLVKNLPEEEKDSVFVYRVLVGK